MKISIDPGKSVYENAAEYFNAAKKLKKKSEDTAKALRNSENELQNFEKENKIKSEKKKEVEELAKQRAAGTLSEPIGGSSRKEWYHQFHWFFTSEGLLAVGGKEAKQNEQLVKKHLGDNDLFFHADIHGASAVILRDGKKANEKSLQETAQFAGCYSTAWKARLPSVDVYAVGNDQVQIAAMSGEYLAKGSFMITGKKQYFKGVEMKMYMGKNKEGKIKIIPSSFGNSELSTCYELLPGRKEKEDIAKELSREFGIKADIIASLLPGRSEAKRL